jgi:hypothetical protein
MSGGHGDADTGGNKGVALLISVLALVLAFAETLGKSAQTAALSYNIEASNLWAFYQSKTIRRTSLRIAAEQLALLADSEKARAQIADWKKTAERYQNEPGTGEGRDQLEARAKAAESIITAMPALVWTAGVLGLLGVAFCAIGFWFPASVHLF